MRCPFPAPQCQSTLQRLFARLDPGQLAGALSGYFAGRGRPARGQQGLAIDGKAQRGRLARDPAPGSVRALSACCHARRGVLAQLVMARQAEKTAAALTVAPRLRDQLPWARSSATTSAAGRWWPPGATICAW